MSVLYITNARETHTSKPRFETMLVSGDCYLVCKGRTYLRCPLYFYQARPPKHDTVHCEEDEKYDDDDDDDDDDR